MRTDRPLLEVVTASAVVTAIATGASTCLPDHFVAVAVGSAFLAATWVLVWRKDDAAVERAGLSFAGLVIPGPLPVGRARRAAARAIAWALAAAALTFVPFYVGFRLVWQPRAHFVPPSAAALAASALGQLVVIALPEEAFFRGYVQSRLDELWPPRLRLAGAVVGPSIVVTSALFALGHVATVHAPARLAVFFPSLLFGWLRARTEGIGASCVYHMLCNVLSEALGRGFGVY